MSKKAKNRAQSLKIPTTIILIAKVLSFVSTKWLVRFAARLFTTPIKHKIPKRELAMDAGSIQEKLSIPSISKEVVVYHYGTSDQKVLLVHGWSGRGTQLVKFAEELIKRGFSTISFDAPAHGKSPGKTTLMPEFIESILEIDRKFGPFKAAIGHSLGGMSLLNAARLGFKVDGMVIIGSGDIVKDIFDEFVQQMKLKPKISDLMRDHFERKNHKTMAEFSAYLSAQSIDIPVLVIHDEDDAEVPVHCARHIFEHLKHGELLITQKLGHRKILGDSEVVQKSFEFINTKQH